MSDDELFDECPLCAEEVDITDLNFKPCTCGYQICTFCFEKICSGDNRCPACRRGYPEERVTYAPATPKQIAKYKALKQAKSGFVPPPDLGDRKHLANTRIEQKNLVYVLGFPMKYNDPDLLRHHDYFGQFGSITKLQISPRARSIGQPASFAVHVTYAHPEEAKKAISALEGLEIEGRAIKATYGMNKYCANFLKFLPCHSSNCLFLHEEVKDNDSSYSSMSGPPRKFNPKPPSGPSAPKRPESRGFGRAKDSKDSKGSALPATASWAKAPSSNPEFSEASRSTISDFPTLSSHIEVALRSPARANQRRGRTPYSSKDVPEPTPPSTVSQKRESSPALAQDPFEDIGAPHTISPELAPQAQADSDLPDPLSGSDLLYSSGDDQGFSADEPSVEPLRDSIKLPDPTTAVTSDKHEDSEEELESNGRSNDVQVSHATPFNSIAPDTIVSANLISSLPSDPTRSQGFPLFGKDSSVGLGVSPQTNFPPPAGLGGLDPFRLGSINDLNYHSKFNIGGTPGNPLELMDHPDIRSGVTGTGFPNLQAGSHQAFPPFINESSIPTNRNTPFNRADPTNLPRLSSQKTTTPKVGSSGSRFQFAQQPSQHVPPSNARSDVPDYMILNNVSNVPTRLNSGSGTNFPPGIKPPWNANVSTSPNVHVNPDESSENPVVSPELETRSTRSASLENQANLFESFNSNGGIEVQLKDLFLADLQTRGKSTLPAGYSPQDPRLTNQESLKQTASTGYPPVLNPSFEHPQLSSRHTRLPSLENLAQLASPTPSFLSGLQGDSHTAYNPLVGPGLGFPPGSDSSLLSRSRQSSIGLPPKQLPPRQKEGSRFFNRSAQGPAASDISSPGIPGLDHSHMPPPHIGSNPSTNDLRDFMNKPPNRSFLSSHHESLPDLSSTGSQIPYSLASKSGPFMNTSLPQAGSRMNYNPMAQLGLPNLLASESHPSPFRPNHSSVPPALANSSFGSFPLGTQGIYHGNPQANYSSLSQAGSYAGFQGPPPTSLLDGNQVNLLGNTAGPYYNNRNFNSASGSLQNDLRNNPGYFPPSLDASGIPSFPGPSPDANTRWPGSLGNATNVPNSQIPSGSTEYRHNAMRPFPSANFMPPPGHHLPPMRSAALGSEGYPSSQPAPRPESDFTKSLESSQKDHVKVVANLDAVLNDAPSSQAEPNLVSKSQVPLDPVTLLSKSPQERDPPLPGSPHQPKAQNQNQLDGNPALNSDLPSSINPLALFESGLVSRTKSSPVTDTKSNKSSKLSPKSNREVIPKLVIPDMIQEVVPPPSPPAPIVNTTSSEVPETSTSEPVTPIPEFALDHVEAPKILPKHLHQRLPDNVLDIIYHELRSTNLIMQKALVESSLKRNKKAKKACKALALSVEQEEANQGHLKPRFTGIPTRLDAEPAVQANRAFGSDLRQTQQELADLAKLVHSVTTNLNYKFDIDFKL